MARLQLADLDPYRRGFAVPKWNRSATVVDVPRLFAQLPEFAGWGADQHYRQSLMLCAAAETNRIRYQDAIRDAERTYGDHGPLISGVVRDHFPGPVKDQLRAYVRVIQDQQDQSLAHWVASGRRAHTWRETRTRMQEGTV